MIFKSLLKSSRLEIITSKRITSFLYFTAGLAIVVWWAGALWQYLYAHIVYKEFDGPIEDLMVVTFLFFIPLFFTGCLMLSGVIQRERVLRWIKRSLIINDYKTQLGPATAGLLVDYEYSVAEIWGTLLKLHFQGNILIESSEGLLRISFINDKQLGNYELLLIELLFSTQNEIVVNNVRDETFTDAGLFAHERLAEDLARAGAYEVKSPSSEKGRQFIKILYGLASFTGVLQIYGMIFGGDKYWGITYPRYEVSIIQPITMVIASIIGLVIIYSGFWLRFDDNHKSRPYLLLLQASGFCAYLKNVYARRMSEDYIQTQAVSDIKAIVPYIIAFKLQPVSMSYLNKILERTAND